VRWQSEAATPLWIWKRISLNLEAGAASIQSGVAASLCHRTPKLLRRNGSEMQVLKGTNPKDAAAVILLRHNTDSNDPEVFWVRRIDKLAFLGGFHAFPGGQVDQADAEAQVENCADDETRAAISCAARELFEELGVLVARGGDLLTKGQRLSLLDDLESGRMSWPALLSHYDLHLDADDFAFAGRWVTPPFSARRFDTWFFLVNCSPRQEPNVVPGELASGEWITAGKAFERWQRSEVLAVPPTLHALKVLSEGLTTDLTQRFLSIPQAYRVPVRRIEFSPNYICFPVRTPTRPPATHTNCYLIYTSEEILIIDPGSPYEDEQQALAQCVDELVAAGRQVREILLTHVHPDHVGGVNALRDRLGKSTTVAAHALTAEPLKGSIDVDRIIEDEESIPLKGSPSIALRALHTPGHARGHLCFYEERTGTLISGDNIVGLGSVLIDPPEGNMRTYLNSLERMRALPNVSVIFGGHGPAIANPYTKVDEYISHRLEREQNILSAVKAGAATPAQIVATVYTDVSPKAYAMAERAVLAHLEKLEEDRLVTRDAEFWQAV
jgi:glyoxylase-like metal-dependent hydrolase (beta-lactamase superfamily II)/8-oxo-dGTP pyrophosphatase MutT (NUDIX family)